MNHRTTPTTAYPSKYPEKKGQKHICRFPPPQRMSIRTADGFIDVEWPEGEYAAYRQDVLNQL